MDLTQAVAVVGLLIAAGTWLVNGFIARRAVRRQTRVEYLLSAYRRLEAASNRDMTQPHEEAIESAISDIQLLGTVGQVELADQFAKQFASDRTADAEPLLENLRRTLRKELSLGTLGPRRTWLRISSTATWETTGAKVRARVLPKPGQATASEPRNSTELSELFDSKDDPSTIVLAAFDQVDYVLRDLAHNYVGANISPGVPVAPLAVDQGLITPATAEALDGLRVMRNLAAHGSGDVDEAKAREFVALADAVLYSIKRDAKQSTKRPPSTPSG
jgi:hypothetical protein